MSAFFDEIRRLGERPTCIHNLNGPCGVCGLPPHNTPIPEHLMEDTPSVTDINSLFPRRPAPAAPTFDEWVAERQDRPDPYPMRALVQMDGWANYGPGDDIMIPDDNDDVLLGKGTHEPQITDTTARVYIDPDADPADAARLLRKMAEWVERDPALLHKMNPARPFDPAYDEPPF